MTVKFSRLGSCAIALVVFFSVVTSASALSWIGKGDVTRPFQDPLNWTEWVSGVGNTNRVPKAGEIVYFSKDAPDLHIGDDDAMLANQLKAFYLENGCRVYWDVTTNAVLYANISGAPTGGMFYKMGKNTALTFAMPLDKADSQFPISGPYTVAEGKLYLPRYSEASYKGLAPTKSLFVFGYCTVSNDATLVLAEKGPSTSTSTQFYRLLSYGLITNENAKTTHTLETRDGSSTQENPSRVYGPIGGKLTLGGNGCIDVYSEDSTYSDINPICSSDGKQATQTVIGFKKFGLSDKTPSSAGIRTGIRYTWSGVLFKYLGTGERTNKQFDFLLHSNYVGWKNNYVPGLDGGPYGGLDYAGQFSLGTSGKTHGHLQFTGSNAAPCVVSGAFYPWTQDGTTNLSVFVYKRGTGTWRFTDGLTIWKSGSKVYQYGGLTGGFAIEEGVLQTDSMSDRYQHSSLGSMTDLYGEYYGVHDETKRVDWAISFGTDDTNGAPLTEGTLESLSTNLAYAADRKMVLRGNGRLKSSGGDAFCMAYVQARTAGAKTLTLDGTNDCDNVLSEVSDGPGEVSVVKEGSGKWILYGNQTFSGDLVVKAGTLEVQAPTGVYNWFRFVDLSNAQSIGQMSELAFYDAAGQQQNIGLTLGGGFVQDGSVSQWVRNEFIRLQPGECLSGQSCWATLYSGGNAMTRIFDGKADNGCYHHGMNAPVETNPVYWNKVALRLTNGAPAIVSYDICRSSTLVRNTKKFRIEGSRDGLLWKTLDERTDTPTAENVSTWMSDGEALVAKEKRPLSSGKGYAIPDGSADTVSSLEHVRCVRVDKGATLSTTYANVGSISNLQFAVTGGGTISGFAFAPKGKIDFVGDVTRGKQLSVAYDLGDGATAANVADWDYTINGAADSHFTVVAGPKGATLVPKGLAIIIR